MKCDNCPYCTNDFEEWYCMFGFPDDEDGCKYNKRDLDKMWERHLDELDREYKTAIELLKEEQ